MVQPAVHRRTNEQMNKSDFLTAESRDATLVAAESEPDLERHVS
ncbi:hypothetical protein EGR_03124 [Echinococcus granulosus]|uniref:Uncharacterized protein n=1 Tax=Echinococcus granulosus TaxID=6210 RepID=W6UM23_ECHGR|nr:hypothetical protein EGR_03124 [Echinococcus granulosus]EUB62103.1 hypothetical protein EGR_03124 [Echinococcus granulosus]